MVFDQVADGLQRQVGGGDLVGAPFELLHDQRLLRYVLLVFELMLDAGLAIHSDRAQLDLHPNRYCGTPKKSQRHGKEHMVASIPVGFWGADIVPFLPDLYAGKLTDQFRGAVNILHKRADHADACRIKHVFCGALQGNRKSPPLKFLLHAVGTFDPGLKGYFKLTFK